MNNNCKDEENYYVIEKQCYHSEFFYANSILGAKIDHQTGCFYDYHVIDGVKNYDDFEIGKAVKLCKDEYGKDVGFEIIDDEICDEVVRNAQENTEFYENLREKYGGKMINRKKPFLIPTAEEILHTYIVDRLTENQNLDLYVFSILKFLSSAMGLRLEYESCSFYDAKSNFRYPEELYEVFSAMYDIISERLAKGVSVNLLLYDHGSINKEYEDFIAEMERRTRYRANYFRSWLVDKIETEKSTRDGSWEYAARLSNMKPNILIFPDRAIYYHDVASESGKIEEITPQEAKENYKFLLDCDNKSISIVKGLIKSSRM